MSVSRVLFAVLCIAACGTDSDDASTTTPVTITGVTGVTVTASGSATMTATGTDTGAPTGGETGDVGTGTPVTGDATMPPVGTTAVDSDPGDSGFMTSTTVDPLTGTSGEPPPPEGNYAAQYIAGDPARLSVRKADPDGDTCVTFTFLSPADGGPLEYDMTLPMPWKVQGALIHQGAADCLSFAGFASEPVMALSGNGAATWAGPACPATLDIDALLAFPQDQPWLPAEVLLQDTGIAVSGC